MLPFRNLATFIGTILLFCGHAKGEDRVIETQPIQPDTSYRLSFKAESGGDNARWLIHMTNDQGERPFESSLEHEWQRIVLGKTDYTHTFLTPPGVESLEIGVRFEGAAPKLSDVLLEKIEVPQLLVNGDFSEGAGNYSVGRRPRTPALLRSMVRWP